MPLAAADYPAAQFEPLLAQPRIIVAVSGGSDSTALLVLLKKITLQNNGATELIAVTVDHRLRSESADEAASVARLCEQLGVKHRILRWDGDKPTTGVQVAARLARHSLIAQAARDEGASLVATGHTLDDQIETVRMRRERGEGIGLAGIAPATLFQSQTWFVRPLIGARRLTLRHVLNSGGIGWIDDPSNQNDAFERVRVRRSLTEPDVERLTAVARSAADERIRLAGEAGRLMDQFAARAQDDAIHLDLAVLSPPDADASVFMLRVLLAAVGHLDHLPDEARTRHLLAALGEGPRRANLGRVLASRHANYIELRRELRRGAPPRIGLRSPWSDFLPSFDYASASALARLSGEKPPIALPWP